MFYLLAEMFEFEGIFNLFRYQTFRAGAAILTAQRRRGDVPINTEVRTLDMGNPGAGDEVDHNLTWDKLEDASQIKDKDA